MVSGALAQCVDSERTSPRVSWSSSDAVREVGSCRGLLGRVDESDAMVQRALCRRSRGRAVEVLGSVAASENSGSHSVHGSLGSGLVAGRRLRERLYPGDDHLRGLADHVARRAGLLGHRPEHSSAQASLRSAASRAARSRASMGLPRSHSGAGSVRAPARGRSRSRRPRLYAPQDAGRSTRRRRRGVRLRRCRRSR